MKIPTLAIMVGHSTPPVPGHYGRRTGTTPSGAAARQAQPVSSALMYSGQRVPIPLASAFGPDVADAGLFVDDLLPVAGAIGPLGEGGHGRLDIDEVAVAAVSTPGLISMCCAWTISGPPIWRRSWATFPLDLQPPKGDPAHYVDQAAQKVISVELWR